MQQALFKILHRNMYKINFIFKLAKLAYAQTVSRLNIKFILCIFLCIFLPGCSRPEVIFHDNQNHVIAASQLKNKWIIFNYWAEWCDNCAAEMAILNQFHQAHPDILLYGVNYDYPSRAELNVIIKKLHIQFPVLLEDPAARFHLPSADYLPMTIVLNPKGKIVKKIVGPIQYDSFVRAIIQLKKS